jgi:hypothetical protein
VQADLAPAVEQAAAAAAQAAEAAAPVADKVKEAVAPAAEQAAAAAASVTAAATTAAVAAVAEAAGAKAEDGKVPVLGQVVEGAAEQAVQVGGHCYRCHPALNFTFRCPISSALFIGEDDSCSNVYYAVLQALSGVVDKLQGRLQQRGLSGQAGYFPYQLCECQTWSQQQSVCLSCF